jgi:molecular chaperone HscB
MIDPFSTLGLPVRFALDPKELDARHRELSKALHPDRYAATASGERRMALSKAIEVNEAQRTLRDPVRRAEALLRLRGLEAEVGETREPKPDGAFLMEVMDAREALDEARASKAPARVAAVVEQARAQHAAALRTLGDAIDGALGASVAGADVAALRKAIPLLGRLRYASRLLDEAIAAEDDLAGL